MAVRAEEQIVQSQTRDSNQEAGWTFLSNHGHILVCIARAPNIRVREIAQAVGITERAVQRIIAELEAAGILERVRNGRRNHYEINTEQHLRHPIEAECTIGVLLDLVAEARRHNIRLVLIFPPTHASYLASLRLLDDQERVCGVREARRDRLVSRLCQKVRWCRYAR